MTQPAQMRARWHIGRPPLRLPPEDKIDGDATCATWPRPTERDSEAASG